MLIDQCVAETADGSRCEHQTRGDDAVCGTHAAMDEVTLAVVPEWEIGVEGYGPEDEPGEKRWEHHHVVALTEDIARELALENAKSLSGEFGIGDTVQITEPDGVFGPYIAEESHRVGDVLATGSDTDDVDRGEGVALDGGVDTTILSATHPEEVEYVLANENYRATNHGAVAVANDSTAVGLTDAPLSHGPTAWVTAVKPHQLLSAARLLQFAMPGRDAVALGLTRHARDDSGLMASIRFGDPVTNESVMIGGLLEFPDSLDESAMDLGVDGHLEAAKNACHNEDLRERIADLQAEVTGDD